MLYVIGKHHVILIMVNIYGQLHNHRQLVMLMACLNHNVQDVRLDIKHKEVPV